jgi:hypothetical protein
VLRFKSARCCGSRRVPGSPRAVRFQAPFGSSSWAASFGTEIRCRRFVHSPAPLEGSGAPARASIYAAVRSGDVTKWHGRGIMACQGERALIDKVFGFGNRTKHALVEVLVALLTGQSNYRLERP